MWVSGYGISAWDPDLDLEHETRQAETDVALYQAITAGTPAAGIFQDEDELLYSGTAQSVVDGDAGQSGLAFADTNRNGRWDSGEPAWADRLISARGVYEHGADTVVDPDGIGTPADGATGAQEGLIFHDLNKNGSWDPQEDIWLDTDAEGGLDRVYDDTTAAGVPVADTLIYCGDAADVTNGTAGAQGDLFFEDTDSDGLYTSGDALWQDVLAGAAMVHDAAVDDAIPGTGTADDGTAGIATGLYFADTAVANGVWDSEEDVWAKAAGEVLGGIVAEFVDQWWPAGPADVHDPVPSEYFGLLTHDYTVSADVSQRLAYHALRNAWQGQSSSSPVIRETVIKTTEDQPVSFTIRALVGPTHDLELRRPKGGYNGTISNWVTRGGLGEITYTPDADFAGADRIDFDVIDLRTREITSGAIIVQVAPVEDPPKSLATDPDLEVIPASEGELLSIVLTVDEPDGEAITFSIDDVADVPGAILSEPVFEAETGLWTTTLSWTPGFDTATLVDGTHDIALTFSASDAGQREVVQLARTIRVQNVNRAPAEPDSIVLLPTQDVVFATEDLTLESWSYSDPDNDPEVQDSLKIRWYKSDVRGSLDAYDDLLVLPASALVPGDMVYCEVWTSDGDAGSATAGRSADITVLNAIDSVTIAPASARTGDELSVVPLWVAPDGATVSYDLAWQKNGTNAGTDATVSSTQTARGQEWTVTLTAWVDLTIRGRHEAPSRSAAVTIADTPPPSPLTAIYDTELPQPGEAVQIVVTAQDPDADGDEIAWEAQWATDVDFDSPLIGGPLPADTTQFKETWYARVRATASDGTREQAVSDWFVLEPKRIGLSTHLLAMEPGWNLLSFPLEPVDDPGTVGVDESTVAGLFGEDTTGKAWYWDNQEGQTPAYVEVDGASRSSTLQPLRGLWVYCTADEARGSVEKTIVGWPQRRDDGTQTIRLLPGWNLIGVIQDFETAPAWFGGDGVLAPAWRWDTSRTPGLYLRIDYPTEDPLRRLLKGQGHWLMLNSDTPLDIDVGTE